VSEPAQTTTLPRRRPRAPAAARSSRGFGLVELMVALTLGMFVVGGACVLFMATRQANNHTDNLSRVQEAVRTSYDQMTRELRAAGTTPCDAQVPMADVLANAQGAAPDWWATWGEPLRGFDGGTAFDGAAFGAGIGQRVAGTAALMLRFGAAYDQLAVAAHDPTTQTFTANVALPAVASGDLLLVCSYRQAAIFQVTSANAASGTFVHGAGGGPPGNCSQGLGIPTLCTVPGTSYQFPAGSLIGRFQAAGWYIGNNGHPETGGRSLFRVTRNGPEEVAEGVRDMQLSYLPAGASDYVAAAAVTDWTSVVGARADVTYESPGTGVNTDGSRLTRTVGYTVNLRALQP
jgi:type IV pilus assembly protein PilW